MHGILQRLAGGDRRSIDGVDAVVAAGRDDPAVLASLIEGIDAPDPVVRLRASDAAEKISRLRPEWLAPYAARLLALAAQDLGHEARWHLALMLPRLPLNASSRRRVERILAGWLDDESRIERVCALQGLADLAGEDGRLRRRVLILAERLAVEGAPSLRARARKLTASLRR